MWLVLCAAEDRSALWAAERLRARGLKSIEVLTPELLTYSFRWQHRLGNTGPPSIEFTLADGRQITGGEIRGVLNRISALPAHLVESLTPADRMYAIQEWTALHVSWLSALSVPVINLPGLQGLCGAWRHPSEWMWLAGRAGLETPPYRLSTEPVPAGPPVGTVDARTVLVLDGQCIEADVPARVAEGCGRLGLLSETRLIGVHVDARTGRFLHASPQPDLSAGGESIITALADALGADV